MLHQIESPPFPTTTKELFFQRRDAIPLAYQRYIMQLQQRRGKGKGQFEGMAGKGKQPGDGKGKAGKDVGKGDGQAGRKPKRNKGRTRVLPEPQ